jgi:hypothetical protein
MQTQTTANAPVAEEVTHWRRDRLLDTGFAPELAAAIACDPRYDLHALIELVEGGCRPDLAVRILAPLDEEDGA